MLSLRNCNPREPAMSDAEDIPVAKRKQGRWRSVFAAIYFVMTLVSSYKKVINKKQTLCTVSYIALDINEDNSSDDLLPSLCVDRKTLTEVVTEKNLETLRKLGAVKHIAASLETDEKDGISANEADLAHRIDVFGANRYQKPPTKSFLCCLFEAFKDTTIVILLVCAILSLGFGIKQHGLVDGWFDGGITIFAVFLAVAVSAVSNFEQNRQFKKLSNKSSDTRVEVVRDGRRRFISVFEVVAGDVACLKIGDQIPADGLFLDGYSLKVDESCMTGESDHIEINGSNNPFVLSGTKVRNGFGSMLVTSVGMNMARGEMMSSINCELDEVTPLQARPNKLTSVIGKIGLAVAILFLAVLLIRYFTGNTKDDKGNKEYIRGKTKLDSLMNSVVDIISAEIEVVAIPEGLPLAVTLNLAYSMKQMMDDHGMVRKLSACETMGSATKICTEKTGTLTLNETKATEFWLGNEFMEDSISSEIAPNVKEFLQQAIAFNSGSLPEISGTPTEKARLSWAVSDLGLDLDYPKQNCELIQVEAFNSDKKRSGVRRNSESSIQAHWKGAAEMILAMCSKYYDRSGTVKDDEERMEMGKIIENMAANSLRCIAFAHAKIPSQ